MARPLRIEFEGALYHVTARGNERKPIVRDDGDRRTWLATLAKTVSRFGWLLHAWCLMDNHHHLVVETPNANLARGMRQLNGVYAQRFNARYRRSGHLFGGRYKALLVQGNAHLLELARYVVLNPVRAGLCAHPAEWRWSSYRATAGLAPAPPFLTTSWLLGQFGRDDTRARAGYRAFVDDAPPRARGEAGHGRGLTPDMAGADAASERQPRRNGRGRGQTPDTAGSDGQVRVYSGPEPPSGGVRRPPFAVIAPHWTQFDGVTSTVTLPSPSPSPSS